MNKGFMKICMVVLAGVLLMVGCSREEHFITDKNYRTEVHKDFVNRMAEYGIATTGIDTLVCMEREAMEFLYAYMPLSDIADYDQSFFLEQVRYAFKARKEMPWGKNVPEDVFRHFVLVYRVNNENLDTARMVMFDELKERVAGMTMEQAALEVNHWCHEHVAYRASDGRTSAPLATMRTSLGRCGEESTFTVTALRAVGIPARQCYTPRWAHCDDNHAWVEVWIGDSTCNKEESKLSNLMKKDEEPTSCGEWKFLGACEPDPRLNMGWFSVPSTRTMMVHTKAFGKYKGTEEVVKRTDMYSELNLLSHYAPTRHVTVTVTNESGRPVENAEVKFKLYNYAEYYTLATKLTDNWGQATLTTGLGDLLIWATDGNQYIFRKLDVRKDSTINLTFGRMASIDSVPLYDFEMVPPVAGEPKVVATEAETAANAKRLAEEDAIRNAYTATFPTEQNYRKHMWANAGLTQLQAWEIIRKSEGNHEEIIKFLDNHRKDTIIIKRNPLTGKGEMGRVDTNVYSYLYDYLSSYSDKDMRDITAEVLEKHWVSNDFNPSTMYFNVYRKGLMPARISNEMVRPYREELASFKGMDADKIRRWVIDSVKVDQTNYYNCPVSPVGVYKLRHADLHSRDIFYVAACRAAGVPAYLDNATNTLYAANEGDSTFRAIELTEEDDSMATGKGKLTLVYNGQNPIKPIYWPNFTLAKLENGDLRTFDFENDPRMDIFPATLELEAGTYCLSTGNRYPDGAVISRIEFFYVPDGGTTAREIVIPPLVERKQVFGALDRNTVLWDGVELWDYASKAGMLYINLGNYGEPSKHLVQELLAHQPAIKQWGGMTYMVGPQNVDMVSWHLVNTDLSTNKGEFETKLLNELQIDMTGNYPLVVLISGEGEILYHSEGYRIGSVEQALKAAR